MKILLAILFAFIALLTRLSFPPDGKLGEHEASVALPASFCYKRVTDPGTYPRWMTGTKSVEVRYPPSETNVGNRFVITLDYGFLGTLDVDVVVVGAKEYQYYAIDLDNWLRLRMEFEIKPVDELKSKLIMRVVSKRNSFFFKHFVHPFAHLYYSNWVTQALLSFQLRYS
ncbi:unnamed protein product [Calicophoron daubneyi]|uniref:Uncharacterized protein n=1 Tax=Calicophoron daubneyi TaxID=300641 RepID=A0AAV2TM74_CALDB